jgi:thiol:disulfide interchange protein DsbA
MFRSIVSIALLTLSVTACGQGATPSGAPPPASAQPANTPPVRQPTAPAQTAESQQATAAQESVSDEASGDRSDTALERLAALPANQQLPDGRWKLGTNYKPLVPPQPTSVPAGKVEVVEVFWYGCPHCDVLEPYITSWMKSKPAYIEPVRVPVMWGPAHRAHAKLFYTLEALKRPDLHQKVFDAIHRESNKLVGDNEAATLQSQLAFAQAQGIGAEQFKDAWNSFSVASSLQRAEQLTQRYRVEGVPLIIVNGKYTTDVGMAGSSTQLIALINDLAAGEPHR